MTDYSTIYAAIMTGAVDDHLMDINHILFERQKIIGKETFAQIKVGDQLRFNSDVGKDLAGVEVTVVEKRRTNVVVETEDGHRYTGNPSLLEAI